MRINYSDDEDFAGQFFLWQSNCDRSLRGKRGQASLRELESALLAMTEKRLVSGEFVTPHGEACALGAMAVQRKMVEGLSREAAIAACAEMDQDESQQHGEALGCPRLVAWKVVEQNDIINDDVWEVHHGPVRRHHGTYKGGIAHVRPMTPEERYDRVLAWVRSELVKP